MQRFFPSYSLYPPPPPHRSRSLTRWGISGFLLFSSLTSQLYRIVLTNKSKVKAHFAPYILSFSFSGAFMCICRLNYTTSIKLDHFAYTVSSSFFDYTGQTEVREFSTWSSQVLNVMLFAKTSFGLFASSKLLAHMFEDLPLSQNQLVIYLENCYRLLCMFWF